ncbi:Lrp/AsnC family transcriptional regulator [Streptomyces sp. ODS28]|uniref:Lrp/AsnC family transcriptional regulator n=1 Tax=Streptomyces sp. ODS28 TaxID=3136688 RepID=UPI0031EEBB5C
MKDSAAKPGGTDKIGKTGETGLDEAGRGETELDETGLALAHALQIAPRAPWTLVGEVLGLSAVTAARRWARISRRGAAWVTATGSPAQWRSMCNAFVTVDCEPAARGEVAQALARDPRTKSVMELASGRDIHANVITRDLLGLSRFVLDQVSRLPGVVRVTTQVSTRILVAGSDWRLDALSRPQQLRLQASAGDPHGPLPVPGPLSAQDRRLLLALAADGRAPVTELAGRLGASQSAVRRRLTRLERSGSVAYRCEVSQNITGWPVTSVLWARAPVARMQQVRGQLSRMPEVRLMTATSGQTNVLLSTWLHSVDAALDLAARIGAECPELEIADHAIVLRTVKRQGWILDELGRGVRCVPIDPWCEATEVAGAEGAPDLAQSVEPAVPAV